MIKRLKRKYILIVMCAVSLVLGIIIASINIANFSSVKNFLDEKLTLIVRNEGKMPDYVKPDKDDNDGEETGEDVEKEEPPRPDINPETPFETRYFSVKFNQSGQIITIDTSKIASVSHYDADDYARGALDKGKKVGFLEEYRFMVESAEDGKTIVVFLNANRELNSFKSFMITSCIISVVGLLMVFVLVILLSNTALKPIIESYEKQKRFITDAGHEMKTPLTVISANTEIIELESGENQWTESIKSQVSKLASLTEKLVILSKMEEGVKLGMSEFSLSDAVYDVSDQYKGIAMSKGISFELDIAENTLLIGNEGEIRRCIGLILDNAFRYVSEGGFVKVAVRKAQGGVEMRFANTARGVERGSLDRWFDRFYRTDVSRNSDTGGSGIGLSVVKAIVLAHGGSVRARSDDGESVEFIINI